MRVEIAGALSLFDDSNAVLTTCTLRFNEASRSGGAIALWESATATLANCTVYANLAGYAGGAIAVETLSRNSPAKPSLVLDSSELKENNAQQAGAIVADCNSSGISQKRLRQFRFGQPFYGKTLAPCDATRGRSSAKLRIVSCCMVFNQVRFLLS